jgi:vacuolar protein sorting-associated protein 8
MALSHDHTFLALGHATGHIQLFDLIHPQKPARHVAPTTLAVVRSGRHEGHLKGSRIIDIGFIGKRHTALASADDRGLAFYHSLGKMLFVDAPDILRILGKYPEDDLPTPRRQASDGTHPQSAPNGSGHATRPRRSKYTILAMMPLPLGTSNPIDTFHIIALLTPAKLVVVGLKPSPRTWFKCVRSDDTKESRSRSKLRGSLVWCPTLVSGSSGAGKQDAAMAAPKLAYTWGEILYIIRVSETKINHSAKNLRSGNTAEVELGVIVHESIGKWQLDERDGSILALKWLNGNVGSFFVYFIIFLWLTYVSISKLSFSPRRHYSSMMSRNRR